MVRPKKRSMHPQILPHLEAGQWKRIIRSAHVAIPGAALFTVAGAFVDSSLIGPATGAILGAALAFFGAIFSSQFGIDVD